MPKEKIWTKTFALLCVSQLLSYANHFLVVPIFALYIDHLGASPFATGLIIAGFAVTGVVIRPLIGYYSDKHKESHVLSAGLLVQGLGTALCAIPYVPIVSAGQIARGVGWSGSNVGGYNLIRITFPESVRGEASGYYTASQQLAVAIFPAIAFWIMREFGFAPVFIISAVIAFTGAAVGLSIKYDNPAVKKEKLVLFDRSILLIFLLQSLLNFSVFTMNSFIALHAKELGINNIWLYFAACGITSITARPLLGKVSDRIGRWQSLSIAFVLQIVTFIGLVYMFNLDQLVIYGIVYSTAQSIGTATALAVAIKVSKGGAAMGTFSMAFPISSAAGSFVAGSIISAFGFIWTFLTFAGVAIVALCTTYFNRKEIK